MDGERGWPVALPAPAEPQEGGRKAGKAKRPAIGLLAGASIAYRGGREVLQRVALSRWGPLGALVVGAAGLALVLGWRAVHKRKVARQGGEEHTPAAVLQQIADSGVAPPAFAEDGSLLGASTIRQLNVFWKINFALEDPWGRTLGRLQAKNLRAWDFEVVDATGRPLASVVKSWEGWARTAFRRADRYTVRVHELLPPPLRQLTFATALATDLALKQDARSFG